MADEGRPLKLRLLLWFYSNANIAGSALALLGPGLLFAGVIGPGWWAITAGLYGAGWMLGRSVAQAPEIDRHIEGSLNAEQTLEKLDELIARMQSHLNTDMRAHLQSVRSSVSEVLPRLVLARNFDADLYTVRETVLRYLPETLANYAALPPVFRSSHVLKDGKTAQQLLADQLNILDSKLREIVSNVASADAQALLANGKFLEARFQQADFLAK